MSMTFWFEWSLPLWECGLKFLRQIPVQMDHKVTPLVGVWIEIPRGVCGCDAHGVTPLAGVWIEIANEQTAFLIRFCHSPCGSVD